MLETGKIYDGVLMEDMSPLGSGFARCDGLGVFVSGAVTGDLCTIEIKKVNKSYADATLLSVDEPSHLRCEAGCALFLRCGGCTLRHIEYGAECALKESFVKSAFSKAGLKEVKVQSIIAPKPEGFRNKGTFRIENGKAGFYLESSHTFVPLWDKVCPVMPGIFSAIAKRAAELCFESEAEATALTVRSSTDGKLHLSFAGCKEGNCIKDAAEALAGEFSEISGVTLLRESEEAELLCGERYLTSQLGGLKFRISPEAFFQVNYEGAEALMDKVAEYAGRCNFNSCADLFCGTGVIGLLLASRYPDRHFTGIEINPRAVEDAKRNRRLNKLGNIDFLCADASTVRGKFELAVVDPPRRGLSSFMVKTLLRLSPEAVIYVSCNPSTLARDAALLAENGYVIEEATPVNMFPRSGHCETICRLSRKAVSSR